MKSHRISVLLTAFLAILLAGCAGMTIDEKIGVLETFPSQFLVGDTYVLKNNQKIDGNIVGIGTTLIIEDGAIVMGDISLIGSNLEVDGRVAGSLNIFAGSSIIRNSAIITGNINQMFQAVEIEPNALVTGEMNTYIFPTGSGSPTGGEVVNLLGWLQPRRILMVKLAQILAMTLVTLLVIYLFREPTLKVNRSIRGNLPAAWGAGLLTYFAAPIIAVVFIVTICLSPVGLIVLLALMLSITWGWVALASIVGEQIDNWFKLDWRVEPAAILGAVILGIATALISFIPCLGIIINLVIASFGLGGVLLSRFGTSKE